MGFRMTACEQSLRDHQNEIAAQRLMIEELTAEMKKQIDHRTTHGQRLDAVFALVDQRFTENQSAISELQSNAQREIDDARQKK